MRFRRKKIYIWCLILFGLYNLNSQTDLSSKKKNKNYGIILQVYSGITVYNLNFNNSFNTFETMPKLLPVKFIGIQVPNYRLHYNPRHSLGFFSFYKFIQENIKIGDSLNLKVNGFGYSMNVYDFNLIKKSKKSNLNIGLGFNTGQIKLSNDGINQRNPFFSPRFNLYYSYSINRFSVYFSSNYAYDVSKTKWLNTLIDKKDVVNIGSFKQDGLNLIFGCGWRFYRTRTKK